MSDAVITCRIILVALVLVGIGYAIGRAHKPVNIYIITTEVQP